MRNKDGSWGSRTTVAEKASDVADDMLKWINHVERWADPNKYMTVEQAQAILKETATRAAHYGRKVH